MILVVCGPESNFADDVHTVCAVCGAAIVHRPHVPADGVKVCMRCAAADLARRQSPITVTISEETRREIALWRAATEGTH